MATAQTTSKSPSFPMCITGKCSQVNLSTFCFCLSIFYFTFISCGLLGPEWTPTTLALTPQCSSEYTNPAYPLPYPKSLPSLLTQRLTLPLYHKGLTSPLPKGLPSLLPQRPTLPLTPKAYPPPYPKGLPSPLP